MSEAQDHRTYTISRGLLRPPLSVTYPWPPPCLSCGCDVTSPSMGGPLVCAPCDMGMIRAEDGSLRRLTDDEQRERVAHFNRVVREIEAKMEADDV
jgi:hypothetical protein